jgi:hypothetical protein
MDFEKILLTLLGGGSGVAIAVWLVRAAHKWLLQSMDDRAAGLLKDALASEVAPLADRMDRANKRLEDGLRRFEKNENMVQQYKDTVLGEVKQLADKSSDWREKARLEFVPRELLDARLVVALMEHVRDCAKIKHANQEAPANGAESAKKE